ncbi:hypothetical protein LTR85_009140 [Meristemomyces frigidus]|nr:hypothetical protein LTR85_009140 [Meristemomyces frigidus]
MATGFALAVSMSDSMTLRARRQVIARCKPHHTECNSDQPEPSSPGVRPGLLSLPLELKYKIFGELFDIRNGDSVTLGTSQNRFGIAFAHPQLLADMQNFWSLTNTLRFSSIAELNRFSRGAGGTLYRGPNPSTIQTLVIELSGTSSDALNDVLQVTMLAHSARQFPSLEHVFLRVDRPRWGFFLSKHAFAQVRWPMGVDCTASPRSRKAVPPTARQLFTPWQPSQFPESHFVAMNHTIQDDIYIGQHAWTEVYGN